MELKNPKPVITDSVRTSGEPVAVGDDAGNMESQGYDEKATRRLRRKIDFALIPYLALLYL